jgi:hypothetical protein
MKSDLPRRESDAGSSTVTKRLSLIAFVHDAEHVAGVHARDGPGRLHAPSQGPHSITSSVRARRVGEIVSPIARAVCRRGVHGGAGRGRLSSVKRPDREVSQRPGPAGASDTLEPRRAARGLGLKSNWPGRAMIAAGAILLLAGAAF